MTEIGKEAARQRAAQYRRDNPDRVKAQQRAAYLKDRDARLVYAANPDRRAKKAERTRASRAANPKTANLKFRAWNYGLTVEVLTTMLEAGCAACGSTDRLHIDHDHVCCPSGSSPRSCGECVRGALCHGCNTALGLVGESADRPRLLIAYLGRRV